MVVFITSVKHPLNAFSYETVWDYLHETLFSVCSQVEDEYRVIVVCNKVLDRFEQTDRVRKKVDFIEVDFAPPSLVSNPVTGLDACYKDRGVKNIVGLIHAKKYNPDYVMFFDADDYVSRNLVTFCNNNPGKPGWYFERGAIFVKDKVAEVDDFWTKCGTSHILNYRTLCTDIPFDRLQVDSTFEEITYHVHPYFLKGVIGNYRNYQNYFKEIHDPLEPFPSVDTATYRAGLSENHSGITEDNLLNSPDYDKFIPLKTKYTKSTHPVAFRTTFSFIDHKRRRIPIFTGDHRCEEIFRVLGLYNEGRLNRRELFSIYGKDVCFQYDSFAFIVNPFDRLVYQYYSSRVSSGDAGYTFKEYLRATKLQPQSKLIPDWVTHVYKLEDVVAGTTDLLDHFPSAVIPEFTNTYPGNYASYYDEDDIYLVTQKFAADLELGGYSFESKSNFCSAENLVVEADVGPDIPNIIHFCFGMKPTPDRFTYIHYIAVMSAIHHNKPSTVYMHCVHEPFGDWWVLVKSLVTVNYVEPVNSIFGKDVLNYAHKSDVVRLKELYRTGGIYLDLDTITLKPFSDLLSDNDCVLGIQDSDLDYTHSNYSNLSNDSDVYGLCNATMLCKPGSEFISEWFYGYNKYDPDVWDELSVIYPYLIQKNTPHLRDKVHITPFNSFFFPLWDKINEFFLSENSFEEYKDLFKNSYSVHLWHNADNVESHVITPDYVKNSKSVYANYARLVHEDLSSASCSLVFLTSSTENNNTTDKAIACLDTYVDVYNTRTDIKEILIHDNGSTCDKLLAYLKDLNSHLGIDVVFSSENLGVAGGRAVLFDRVSSDIVFSLDSDSSVTETYDFFFDTAKFVLSDKSVGITGVCGSIIHSLSKPMDHSDVLDGELDDKYNTVSHVAGCCQIFRRSLLQEISLDTAYSPFWYEDTDFCFQAQELGYRTIQFNSYGSFKHEWACSGGKCFPHALAEKFKHFADKWFDKFNNKLVGTH